MAGRFLARVVERRLLQILGLYVGAGWGLLQFTDWAVGHFGLDPALTNALIAIWALMLPVVAGVAWTRAPGVSEPVRPWATAPGGRSILVLPFANLGANPDDSYLSDGITEEIITALSRLDSLRVVPRTTAFAYRGRLDDVRRIGRELRVQTVLEGSVRRADDHLRVSTQLVHVQDGYTLWSEHFDSELSDIFAIEDEIAERVATALRVILREEDRRLLLRGECCDLRAYEFYLRGRQFFRQTTRKSLHYARDMFRHALSIDASSALAHAGLAVANSLLRMYYPASEADMQEAERASVQALKLAPGLAESHSAHGAVLFLTGRPDEAESEFRTALELGPRLFEARYLYARMCFQLGRLEEAGRLFEEALAVEENHEAAFFAAQSYEALHDDARAAGAYRRALAIAERHMELNPDDARAATIRAVSLCRLRRVDEGVEWAERALAIDPEDAGVRYNVACLFAVAGRSERAIACLEEAVRSGFGNRQWLERDPDIDALRDDPRFKRLLFSMDGDAAPTEADPQPTP